MCVWLKPATNCKITTQPQQHGGYPGNRNVRYGAHNMADAQGAKNRHVCFSIKTAFNKMI